MSRALFDRSFPIFRGVHVSFAGGMLDFAIISRLKAGYEEIVSPTEKNEIGMVVIRGH